MPLSRASTLVLLLLAACHEGGVAEPASSPSARSEAPAELPAPAPAAAEPPAPALPSPAPATTANKAPAGLEALGYAEDSLLGVSGVIGGEQVGVGGLGTRGSGLGGGGLATTGSGGGDGGYSIGTFARREEGRVGKKGVSVQQQALEAPPGDDYAAVAEEGLQTVADSPLSTFSIDVDTASYANVRRYLEEGTRPPADAVRVEEMLNYFRYDYAGPTGDTPFAAHAEVTDAPWADGHRLVRIGVQGRRVDARETPPRNLVFLVDVSGSMASEDRLPLVKRGLHLLAGQLGPQDHVAMVVYAGAAGVVLPPTRGDRTEEIEAAIEQLSSGGSTAGGAGIQAAYQLARRHFQEGAVNRVILATDGDFNVGTTSDAELTRLVEHERESGVFLTVLGVGRGNLHDARMELLADKGNGNYAYIDGWPEMRRVLGEQVGATIVTIAKDVKIQVEFNPAEVSAWRLVGYENRKLAARDFDDDRKDAGEIGAGHSVTALYEVVPATRVATPEIGLKYQGTRVPSAAAGSGELLTVKLRYKQPDGDTSKLLSFPVRDDGRTFARASADTRFAAAVAGFGMLLRGSPNAGSLSWAWVKDVARESVGEDPGGYRAEFVGLVDRARRLTGT